MSYRRNLDATTLQSLVEAKTARITDLESQLATLHSQIDGLMKRLLKSEANEKLVRFALWAISEHRDNECADIDGCAIQEKLTELGILVERQMTQSCGEHCVCMEFGEHDEWSCYFLSDDVVAVKAAMASQGGGDG